MVPMGQERESGAVKGKGVAVHRVGGGGGGVGGEG